MLNENLHFNYRSIRSYTSYSCEPEPGVLEREISFHVMLGPAVERRGDVFPVFEVPAGRMVWLSDWSFNSGGPLDRTVSVGGSLGRITAEGRYIYVLNCSVCGGEMRIFSPARPIRYLAREWIAVCFHHMGAPVELPARATFRLTQHPAPAREARIATFQWGTSDPSVPFPGPG